MKLSRLIAASALTLACAASLVAAPSSASPRCVEAGGRVLAISSTIVVYRANDTVIGCLRSTGRRTKLAAVGGGPGGDIVAARRYRLAGRFVAFESVQSGEQPQFAVSWVDLRSGRDRARETGPRDRVLESGAGPLTDLVVNERGATAWIVKSFSEPTQFQVRAPTRGGTRQLDSGTTIEPKSLVRRGARQVCWTVADDRRCATLPTV